MKLQTLKSSLQVLKPQLQSVGQSWRRSGMTTGQRGYNYRWQKARARFLFNNPLCCYCEREHRVEVATVVDHRIPHRGNVVLFWDESNWQPLCRPCHDIQKAREERGTLPPRHIGADGWPADAGACDGLLPQGGRSGNPEGDGS